jgi:hypothetical protein
MLSKLELMFDLEQESVAYVLEDVKNPKIGTEIKVFIPRVMQNINEGVLPEEPSFDEGDICKYQYNNCFINDENCKPEVSEELFRSQNYITGLFDNDTKADPVLKIVRKPNKELVAVHIEKKTKVRSMFLNGKLNQLRITLKDTTEDKSYDEETAADELAYKEGITIDTTTSNKTGSGNIKKKSKTSKKK